MKTQAMIDAAVETARQTLEAGGELCGLVVLHTKIGILPLPYKDGSAPEEIQRILITGLVRGCRRHGDFLGVILMAEAWGAPVTKPELIGVLRPSLDPDRRELFIAWAYDVDGNKQALAVPIISENGKRKLGTPETFDSTESWLDDALKD